jgi:endonuclease/exonuclease/phosphatase family metal-dependent hydrolase
VALVAVIVASFGIVRRPAGPADGVQLDGDALQQAGTKATIRIATLNIHRGVDAEGNPSVKRLAEAFRDFDLVGLNEVAAGVPLIDRACQTEDLGRATGMGWLFAATQRRFWSDTMGNGLLTRLPIRYWMRTPLPGVYDAAARNILLVRVDHHGVVINFLITHLGRGEDRPRHLAAAAELFLSLDAPAVLMGDLNAPATHPILARLLQTPGVVDCHPSIRYAGPERSERIDFILVRGLDVIDSGMSDDGLSDHPLLWAELRPTEAVSMPNR